MRALLETIEVGTTWLTIDQVLALARGQAEVALSDDPTCLQRINATASALHGKVISGVKVYGVTTGFGESCINDVDVAWAHDLARNLVRFHGVGTGAFLSAESASAVMVVRLASLARGYSGVRVELLRRMCDVINAGVSARIPSEGSVGASGDLTPLSYVAALLMGEREASVAGEVMASSTALARVGLAPFVLAPKESLALMNGTSVMAALAVQAIEQARRLSRWSAGLTAMMSQALAGNPGHFDDRIFGAKPHPGQRRFAAWVRTDLGHDCASLRQASATHQGRLQDRYSIRCAPHVVGVLEDVLAWAEPWIEVEINGANDNPLLDPETGDVLHGGNFYGGHACFVADGLKNAVANLADLLDRQLALLCSAATNNGLPENLVAQQDATRVAHHGFKAMQIAASALAAEALKLAAPASVFSRSTECHNQDKVSMGTIAAREALRIGELTERVAAICTLALCQAMDLRPQEWTWGPRAMTIHRSLRALVPAIASDRRQDLDIETVVTLAREGQLDFGARA